MVLPPPATSANGPATPPTPPAPAPVADDDSSEFVLVDKEPAGDSQASAEALPPPPPMPRGPPLLQQLDCIVLDVSRSMKVRCAFDPLMSREDLSKLVFHTMVDALLALEMEHSVGLIAFGAELTPTAPTERYEDFHTTLGRLDAKEGRTRLWDAILAGAQQLVAFRDANKERLDPAVALRVFALTDGEDNASVAQPWAVARFLQDNAIVLDAFPMADFSRELVALTKATGGACVSVTSIDGAIQIFNDEATMHLAAREREEKAALVASPADLLKLVPAAESGAAGKAALAAALSTAPPKSASTSAAAAGGPVSSAEEVLRRYEERKSGGSSGDVPSCARQLQRRRRSAETHHEGARRLHQRPAGELRGRSPRERRVPLAGDDPRARGHAVRGRRLPTRCQVPGRLSVQAVRRALHDQDFPLQCQQQRRDLH